MRLFKILLLYRGNTTQATFLWEEQELCIYLFINKLEQTSQLLVHIPGIML